MGCCNCCCPDGESCCQAQGPDGICCDPAKCCGTSAAPVCCSESETCCGRTCCPDTHVCCENTCCAEGQCCVEGECQPCDPPCESDEDCDGYCCDGECQEEPCDPPCISDEDCRLCEEGVLVTGVGPDDTTVYTCCPEGSTGVFPFGDPRAGRCCVDCSEQSEEEGTSGTLPTSGYCCDGGCQEEPCGPSGVCCTAEGNCTGFCTGPVCDNYPLPGETPDGGPCCDGFCIECGDCGEGGAECCNSVELSSIFDALSDQPESIACDAADAEVSAAFGPVATAAWAEYAGFIRFGEAYKFSIMRRSYILDALYAIEDGDSVSEAMAASRQQWAILASQYRGVING